MVQPKNAFEIFRLLEKSNCGNCGEKTCLAFAGAVFKGQRRLDECPRLDRSVIEWFSGEFGLGKSVFFCGSDRLLQSSWRDATPKKRNDAETRQMTRGYPTCGKN
jgi:Na+-translocating ferredoxin:NAD+ oxidoreductase RNF subunit RnfB